MRAALDVALVGVVSRYEWALCFQAEERIGGRGSVHARVPMGPTQDVQFPRTLAEGFLPRAGTPVLIVRLFVDESMWRFYPRVVESSIDFPLGSRMSVLGREAQLAALEIALERTFKRSRIE